MARRGNGASCYGAGCGPGWGGPARGPGKGPDALLHDPAEIRRRHAEAAPRRAARAEELERRLFEIALTGASEEAQLAACVALHARLAGRPVARVITVAVDPVELMSDAELQAELRRLAKASR